MSVPFSLLFGDWYVFYDQDGTTPLASGTLTFSVVGTSTPQAVYADSDGNVSLGAVVTLDANGRSATGIYLLPNGYKLIIADALGAPVNTQDGIEDIGQVWLWSFGRQQAAGVRDQTNVTPTNDDNLITMNGGTVNLQPASDRAGLPLIIKSIGASTVAITPNGAETIDDVAGAYTLAAASSPSFPTVTLYPDIPSNWWKVVGS